MQRKWYCMTSEAWLEKAVCFCLALSGSFPMGPSFHALGKRRPYQLPDIWVRKPSRWLQPQLLSDYNHGRDPGWELPSWVRSTPRIVRDDDTWYFCFMLLNLGWFVTQQSLEQRTLLETLENIHWDGPSPSSCLATSQAVPMACVFSKSSVD